MLFHFVIELFCIIITTSMFVIAGNTYKITRDSFFVLLGVSYGFVGFFISLHVITYSGTGILMQNSYNLSVQLRLVSIFIESIALLVFSLTFYKKCNMPKIFHILFIISAFFLLSIFYLKIFPVCYIDGVGLTPFNKIAEYGVCGIFIISMITIIKNKQKFRDRVFWFMVSSMISAVASEVLFSLYNNVLGIINMSGHVLKMASFYFIYKAVVDTSLNMPYKLLKEVNSELKLQKAYFEQLFESSPEGIVILDNSDRVVNINKGFEELFHFTLEEIRGAYLNDVIVPEKFYSEATNYSSEVINGRVLQKESVRKRKDDSLVNVQILGYPIKLSDEQVGVYGIYRDITEKKKSEENIRYLSFHDKLTDLYNRAFFEEELLRIDTERQFPISLIMGDLNNLKLANDIFGHEEGDRLLVKIAEILRSSCREEDVIARWGGDEFVILLPKTDEEAASSICSRIKEACKESESYPVQPSISLGADTRSSCEESVNKMLSVAEMQMYKNKQLEHEETQNVYMPYLGKSYLEKHCEIEEKSVGL